MLFMKHGKPIFFSKSLCSGSSVGGCEPHTELCSVWCELCNYLFATQTGASSARIQYIVCLKCGYTGPNGGQGHTKSSLFLIQTGLQPRGSKGVASDSTHASTHSPNPAQQRVAIPRMYGRKHERLLKPVNDHSYR